MKKVVHTSRELMETNKISLQSLISFMIYVKNE